MRRGIAVVFAVGCSFRDGSVANTSDGAHPSDAPRSDGTPSPVDARPIDARPDADPCAGYATLPGAPTTSRYRIYGWTSSVSTNQSRSFGAAAATCASQGTHLAIADSAQESGALVAAIPLNPMSTCFWDGVTDAAIENVWITVLASQATYLPWAASPQQPNGGTAANCAVMSQGALLYDWDCNASYPFACECE